jgi:acetyltransferase-like isoleucine patch superfamily enzyme
MSVRRLDIKDWSARAVRTVIRHAKDFVAEDSGDHLTMSEHSYGPPRLLWANHPGIGVTIGKYSSVSDMTEIILGGYHRPEWVSTYPFHGKYGIPESGDHETFHRGPVAIGNDVWVGYKATILSGVTIADGAVVAAGSMVTKDVEPYAIVAGNPAVIKSRRFDDATCQTLLKIAWWHWPHEMVLAHVEQLCSANIAEFVGRHDPMLPERHCAVCSGSISAL